MSAYNPLSCNVRHPSDLADLAQTNKLPAPTNARFRSELWLNAAKKFAPLNEADQQLLDGALWVADRLTTLRETFSDKLALGKSHVDFRCVVAAANASYLFSKKRFEKEHLRFIKKGGPVNPIMLGKIPTKSRNEYQNIVESDLTTSLVDLMPHALFHSSKESISSSEIDERLAFEIFLFANLESIYRDSWQKILWEGYRIEDVQGDFVLKPDDDEHAKSWPVWDIRRESLLYESTTVSGFGGVPAFKKEDFSEFSPPFAPVRLRKVTGKKNEIVTNKFSRDEHSQTHLASIISAIRDSYLTEYIDTTFVHDGVDINLKLVIKAWVSITRLVRIITPSVKGDLEVKDGELLSFLTAVSANLLQKCVSDCLGIETSLAKIIISFLTIDVSDASYLFTRGAWAKPLFFDKKRNKFYCSVPVFELGNDLRAFELWLEQAGFAGNMEVRGRSFETGLATEIRETDTKLLRGKEIEVSAGSTKVDGLEIDLMVRVDDLLLVIECKSYITPGDPIDRYHVYNRIKQASSQAKIRADKIRELLENSELRNHIDANLCEQVSEIFPLVVINSPYGCGLKIDDVSCVDASYLLMLLANTEVMTAMGYNRFKGVMVREVSHLYVGDVFNKERFCNLLSDPFVQHKFFDQLSWRLEQIPSGFLDRKYLAPFPSFEQSAPEALATILTS